MKPILCISMILVFTSCSLIQKHNTIENRRSSTTQTVKEKVTKAQAETLAQEYFFTTSEAEWLLRKYPKYKNKELWTIETHETDTSWVVSFLCKAPVILTEGPPTIEISKETGAVVYRFLREATPKR